MYCQKCGKKMPEGSAFCPECGAEQKEEFPAPKGAQFATEENKKKTAILLGALGAICGIMIIWGLCATFIKPTINLNKYVTIEYEGYDGYATAYAEFDRVSFTEKYGKKLAKIREKNEQSSGNFIDNVIDKYIEKKINDQFDVDFFDYDDDDADVSDEELAVDSFLYHIDGELDADTYLSNGDEIAYIWDCEDDYILDTYGYKLKYEDMEFIVHDLPEVDTFDAFAGVNLRVEGIAPYGEAYLDFDDSFCYDDLTYWIDGGDGLNNGDTVTVYVDTYYDEDLFEHCINYYGAVPKTTTKTYTVSNLYHYATGYSDISADMLARMQQTAVEDFYEDNYFDESNAVLQSLTYMGGYFFSSDEGDENLFAMVYQAQVHNYYYTEYGAYDAVNTFYWFDSVYEIIDDGNNATIDYEHDTGDCVGEMYYDSLVYDDWGYSYAWDYYGYYSLDAVLNTLLIYDDYQSGYSFEDVVDPNAAVTPVAATQAETPVSDGCIFSNSSGELIPAETIQGLTDDELRLAINEIYARHGYIFEDQGLSDYYSQFSWYAPVTNDQAAILGTFNDIERANLDTMQAVRDSRG